LIPLKRLSQGFLEGLASQNRAAGSGGGGGLSGLAPEGTTSWLSNQATSSTSAVDVTGSSIPVQVSRAGTLLALAMVTAHMQAGPAGSCSATINGSGSSSTRMRFPGFGTTQSGTTMGYLLLNNLQPGITTMKLQFYVDFNTDTMTLIDWKLDVFFALQ
jgi:hypothetical protein